MKKKVWLTGLLLCLCLGLTACGNPLKKLPEATGDNIYDEDDESTGNEAADEIIDELMDSDDVKGDEVVAFAVDDRDDDEDSKDRSELKVILTTQSDVAEYTYYFEVKCRYDKDRGWRVKSYELNNRRESTVTPLSGVDKDAFENALKNSVYSAYVGNSYLYFNDVNITDIKIDDEEITPGIINADSYYDRFPKSVVSAKIGCEGDYCVYTIEGDFTFYFYPDSDSDFKWSVSDYSFSEDYEVELTEGAQRQLSDDAMLDALSEKEIYFGSLSNVKLTRDAIDSYSFENYRFSGNSCYRTVQVTLADTDIFTINASVDLTFSNNGGNWTLTYVSIDKEAEFNDGFRGDYSAPVLNSSDEPVATIYYSFLGTDSDGNVTGAVKYVPDGKDAADIDAVAFTGTVNTDSLRLYLSFDEYLIRDGWWSSFDSEYLYYNVETQRLEATGYSRHYSLNSME